MSLVLDSSVTLAWVYGDETTPAIRTNIAERGVVVPGLWWLEVANSLSVAVRRQRRIDAAFRQAALSDLVLLDITTDQQIASQAWSETLRLADQNRLTLYDAAYLKLARRRGLPLATLDQALRDAAAAIGMAVLGLSRRPNIAVRTVSGAQITAGRRGAPIPCPLSPSSPARG